MYVRLNLAALSQTKPHEYAIRFVFGGLITVATGLIAHKFGPEVGGLFLAFPAIFPATATLVAAHQQKKKYCAGIDGTARGRDAAALEARDAALGAIGLLGFAAIVWRFLPGHSAPAVLITAAAMWLAVSVALWRARQMLRGSRR